MKLIDLLVQELPKRGGWPKGCAEISQDADGCMCIWKVHGARCGLGYWVHYSGVGLLQYWSGTYAMPVSDDAGESIITREQYESALAASKPQWDGDGLPPVGIEAEVSVDGGRTWCLYKATSEHNGMRLVEIGDFTEEFQSNNWMFRPIRSESDKKRAKGVVALSRVDPAAAPFEYGDKHADGSLVSHFWYELYDAIAAGKVDGIKLED